jgi:hypothetical protein
MCIAILNPSDVTLEKSVLKNCWSNNKDGAGMLYLVNGVLTIHKEMKNFDSFYKHYLGVRDKHKDSQVVIHFRISTHGKVDLTNCHPFIVNDDWGFVHNGIISAAPTSKDYSDTYMFNREVLQKLPKDWMFNEGIYELVLDYIGSSKLLFLNTSNEAYIVNEEMGLWDLGCWFSNRTYKPSSYYDFGGKQVAKTDTKIIPSTTKWGSNWVDEDDDLADWNDSFDYKYNYDTMKYEKVLVDKIDEDTNPDNPWKQKANQHVYQDECESCLEHKDCLYDYAYECSVCEQCANDIHAPF